MTVRIACRLFVRDRTNSCTLLVLFVRDRAYLMHGSYSRSYVIIKQQTIAALRERSVERYNGIVIKPQHQLCIYRSTHRIPQKPALLICHFSYYAYVYFCVIMASLGDFSETESNDPSTGDETDQRLELVAKKNTKSKVWKYFGFMPNEDGSPSDSDTPKCRLVWQRQTHFASNGSGDLCILHS